jgi:hypothetical protein
MKAGKQVIHLLALIFALLTLAQPASAYFYDGNSLLRVCEQKGAGCTGYVAGIHDGNADRYYFQDYCLPDGVELGQLVDVVIASLRGHPEQRHLHAAKLVQDALVAKFPCKP